MEREKKRVLMKEGTERHKKRERGGAEIKEYT